MMGRNQAWRQTGSSMKGNDGSKCMGGWDVVILCGGCRLKALVWRFYEGRHERGAWADALIWAVC